MQSEKVLELLENGDLGLCEKSKVREMAWSSYCLSISAREEAGSFDLEDSMCMHTELSRYGMVEYRCFWHNEQIEHHCISGTTVKVIADVQNLLLGIPGGFAKKVAFKTVLCPLATGLPWHPVFSFIFVAQEHAYVEDES